MKVIDHLKNAKESLISFEIIPPLRGGSFYNIEKVISDLVQYDPPFIDVTSHGSKKSSTKRKRPGTLGICAIIQHKYGIDAVPHVLCEGFTKEETEDFLIDLHYIGIDNILAVKGDPSEKKGLLKERSRNNYALDLVKQITAMNDGIYLDGEVSENTNFCIGVAGYPEIHLHSKNLDQDIYYLKRKVKAGAEYIVTQMFFDNQKYFNFVDKCREEGITIPIIPGLKILTTYNHLNNLPKIFNIDLPDDLIKEVSVNRQYALDIGVEWATNQAKELISANVPAVHFFVMGTSKPVKKVLDNL